MSNEGFKLQASVKDADGDMVNVRADSAAELESALLDFPVGAYAQFKANVRGGQALGTIVQPQAVQQAAPVAAPQPYNGQQGPAPTWATGTPQQAAPAQPQQQGGRRFGGPPHPEGKTCEACTNVLELKKTGSGKETWRCPDWRWNSGNPNGHSSEWVN